MADEYEKKNIHVQIMDEKPKKQLSLYPANFACDVIITEDPLMTLDEWLKLQEAKNALYDKAMEKINAYERESVVYQSQFNKPKPNPTHHLLWSKLLYATGEALSADVVTESRINVYRNKPTNQVQGHIYLTSNKAIDNNLEKLSKTNVRNTDTLVTNRGDIYIRDEDFDGYVSFDTNTIQIGGIKLVSVNPDSPSIGDIWVTKK